MNYNRIFLFIVFAIFGSLSLASAGVFIRGSEVNLHIENDRIRMETKLSDRQITIVFRNDKDLIWIIDDGKKEYRQMTREDIKKLKSKLDDGMAMMQEKMKNLTPEQRKMMAQIMPSNIPVQKIETILYTPEANDVKVNSWTCTHYIGSVRNQKTQEIWAAGWDQFDITANDLQALSAMGEFFKAFAPKMPNMLFDIGRENAGFSGIPVRAISYHNDTVISDFRIIEITKKQLDASLFEIPADFSLQPINPDGMF